jgi:Fe-Mn family superoxide dismutase
MIVRYARAFCRRNGIPESRAKLIPESAASYTPVAIPADAEPRAAGGVQPPSTQERLAMDAKAKGPFTLPKLPWAEEALAPVISARTIQLHHGKHHKAYVDKLNGLVAGTRFADMPLDQVVRASAGEHETKVFNNAAQAWNHAFFWNCLKPGGGKPSGDIARRLESDLGGVDAFGKEFAKAAVECFGSGWAWLVERAGKLEIVSTSNAGTPLTTGATPLLTLDVWEHAYYVDYENRRPEYVEAVIAKLLNWEFAAQQLDAAHQRKAA